MLQRVKDNKFLLAISLIIIILILVLISRIAFAYLTADVLVDDNRVGETTATGDTLIFSKGQDLSLTVNTDNFSVGADNPKVTVNPSVTLISSAKTNNAQAKYTTGIIISENTYQYSTTEKTAELILTVKNITTNNEITEAEGLNYVTVNGVSGFDVTEAEGIFNIVVDHDISSTSSTTGFTHNWEYTLTFINFETDQSINETASFVSEVFIGQEEKVSLASHIKSLYTTDGENALYLHDSDLANGANDGSYRYAGASDGVNNYICLGSSEEICPDENIFRVIGVFGSQVKVIKSTSYGDYLWSGSSTNVSNVWGNSSLNTSVLNNTYLNSLSFANQIDVPNGGWQVGGNAYANISQVNAMLAYTNEIISPAEALTSSNKIGLMYVSDYGYAASQDKWSTYLNGYNASIDSNWLYLGSNEWTITRSFSETGEYNAFYVVSTGQIDSSAVNSSSYAIRPVFYLSSSATYASGTGTSIDPFKLSVE